MRHRATPPTSASSLRCFSAKFLLLCRVYVISLCTVLYVYSTFTLDYLIFPLSSSHCTPPYSPLSSVFLSRLLHLSSFCVSSLHICSVAKMTHHPHTRLCKPFNCYRVNTHLYARMYVCIISELNATIMFNTAKCIFVGWKGGVATTRVT